MGAKQDAIEKSIISAMIKKINLIDTRVTSEGFN